MTSARAAPARSFAKARHCCRASRPQTRVFCAGGAQASSSLLCRRVVITLPRTRAACSQRDVVVRRNEDDSTALESLVGRIVYKYFPGYGNFLGMIRSRVQGRPVVDVAYEVCVPPGLPCCSVCARANKAVWLGGCGA